MAKPALEISGKPITLESVSRSWGETVAVDNLSIEVPAGSFTALLGPLDAASQPRCA